MDLQTYTDTTETAGRGATRWPAEKLQKLLPRYCVEDPPHVSHVAPLR